MDVDMIISWLRYRQAKVGQVFTQSRLYHDLQQFRPDRRRGSERRHAAINYLVGEEIVERCWPPRRPGVGRGRPPGRGFLISKLP
jgi:hypothetical protein